jgi:hypothetical protein
MRGRAKNMANKTNLFRITYSAVVESGSHSIDGKRWEERRNYGHAHRTIEAAKKCGAKLYNARYVNGSWTANAEWNGYTVHTRRGERVTR